MSSNWQRWDDIDDIKRFFDFMEETGWCLVWTPNPDVIEALLDAPPESRTDVLHQHEDAILNDLEACLAEVQRPELDELRLVAGEAVQSYRAGLLYSAQATATVVLTTVIHVQFGIPTFKQARDEFARRTPMAAQINRFRLIAIVRVVYHSIAEAYGNPDENLPTPYNRHRSTHGISRVQFNRTNALAALMLIVPLVRELDQEFARDDSMRDSDAA